MPDDLRDRAARLRASLPGERPRASPPQDTGRRLATLPREERGQRAELRVSWAEYEGRPYVSLRVWTFDDVGAAWPTKVGVTVRLRELPAVAEALAEALELAERHAGERRARR